MPNAFNFAASPFDCLSPDEQRLVRASVDIALFPPRAPWCWGGGRCPRTCSSSSKGFVARSEGDEVQATYGPDDLRWPGPGGRRAGNPHNGCRGGGGYQLAPRR